MKLPRESAAYLEYGVYVALGEEAYLLPVAEVRSTVGVDVRDSAAQYLHAQVVSGFMRELQKIDQWRHVVDVLAHCFVAGVKS